MIEAGTRILDMSEAAMRDAISQMPDGTYEFTDWLDDDGIDLDVPIKLEVKLTIAGDRISVDLSGCSAQVQGPTNATLASTNSAVMFAIMSTCMSYGEDAFAANAGCYRPVTTIAPEGTVVNARHPAPVVHRIAISHRLVNAMFGALHQAVPERIPAAYYGNSYVCTFQTVAADSAREVLVEIEIGGTGAHPKKDGVNALSSGMHNNSNIPIEMIEAQMPLTVTRYGLIPNSGGTGTQRGGLGLAREWRIDAPRCFFTANMDRFVHAPYGLAGGGAASLGKLVLTRDGIEQPLPPKSDNVPLRQGDRVRLETSGGGGFGDPATRDPAARARDTALGYTR
jgi:N-methylhydantoinase B/oxoprolinase/acetone carboxylase alpha subunit